MINAKQQREKRHNQFIYQTLSSLSHNPKTKMCKFDKGKTVAVLNSEDYYATLDVIVNDNSKFVEINTENQSNQKILIRKYFKDFCKKKQLKILYHHAVLLENYMDLSKFTKTIQQNQ